MRSLSPIYKSFRKQLFLLEQRASDIRNEIGTVSAWRTKFLTETLISELWQAWCLFCRNLLLQSCLGARTRSGNVVASRLRDNSWRRLGYEAAQSAKRKPIKPGKSLSHIRQEPTWGDQNKIIDIINGLQPINKNELLTAFGLPLLGPKHLQTVRNACAHKNQETIAAVMALQLYYRFSSFSSPHAIAWELEISRNQLAFFCWIDDLAQIADSATNSP